MRVRRQHASKGTSSPNSGQSARSSQARSCDTCSGHAGALAAWLCVLPQPAARWRRPACWHVQRWRGEPTPSASAHAVWAWPAQCNEVYMPGVSCADMHACYAQSCVPVCGVTSRLTLQVRMWSASDGALQPLWGRWLHAGIAAACTFTADGSAVLSVSKAGEIVLLVGPPSSHLLVSCGVAAACGLCEHTVQPLCTLHTVLVLTNACLASCTSGRSAAGRAGACNGASAAARLPPPLEWRGGALRSEWHGAAGRSSGYSRCAGHFSVCFGCCEHCSAQLVRRLAAHWQVTLCHHLSSSRRLVSVVQMGCRWQQLRRQQSARRCTASAAAQMARCWLPAVSCASCLSGLPIASMV
jgi:hypothetical protein